jgi:hypothetical protein
MPGQVRMTAKAARQYVAKTPTTPAPPPKPKRTVSVKPSQSRKGIEEGDLPPQIGACYRVARGMAALFTTPPPIGTICTVWHVSFPEFGICLEGVRLDTDAKVSFSVRREELAEYFEEVEEG